jgi:hypothetical protein
MSHFSVLVITDNKPTEDALNDILAPWHEFECTGWNNQYVIDEDVTEESLGYGEGDLLKALSYHGLEDKVVADESEVNREVDHKYGYAIVKDGKLIKAVNRTNPNNKWDWWVIGGRFSGHLRLKPGATPTLGRRGLMGAHADDHPIATDQAMLSDVDLHTMREEARARALQLWDEVHETVADKPEFQTWDEIRESAGGIAAGIDIARERFWGQPAVAALKERFPRSWGLDRELDAAKRTRDEYGQRNADDAIGTFAFVKDGQWIERGQMGWFACVANEKDRAAWSAEFNKMLDALPPTTWLTVVDCHI